jgi:hypothetical protein
MIPKDFIKETAEKTLLFFMVSVLPAKIVKFPEKFLLFLAQLDRRLYL